MILKNQSYKMFSFGKKILTREGDVSRSVLSPLLLMFFFSRRQRIRELRVALLFLHRVLYSLVCFKKKGKKSANIEILVTLI